jgi:hypothetical protein
MKKKVAIPGVHNLSFVFPLRTVAIGLFLLLAGMGSMYAAPVISTSGSLSAVNTCQGTASSSTSFNVSGTNMNAGILVTPPAGFEVSLSAGSGYASTVTVGAAGTIASTPVYVRLAAATTAGTYSGNIVLSSSGASNVNVATVASTVYTYPALSQKPAGLTSYYKFSGNANDTTGANNGTLQNSPTSVTDRLGNASSAYSFNGTNQYVSTTVSYANPTTFSLSIWFKTTVANNGVLIGFGNVQTGNPSLFDRYIWMNGGKVSFFAGATSVQSTATYNDGNWHMATATMSSVNGMNLYIDGASVASSANTASQSYTGWWTIGYSNNAYYFSGTLDDATIYTTTALTATQVSTLYSGTSSNTPVCAGSSINLTETSISGATYSWTGPNGFSSASQNPTISNAAFANAGTYTVTVTSHGCSSTGTTPVTVNAVPVISQKPAGLTSYYKFSGNANDSMGVNNGTLQNSPTSVADRYGNASSAYSFNGSTQYVSTATSYTNPSPITISAWFNTTSSKGVLVGFANTQTGNPGSYDRNLFMYNGRIGFGIWQGGLDTIVSPSTYNDGNWHMATATVSSTNGSRVYVDGVLVASNSSYNAPQNYTGYWRFGYNSSWFVDYFTGTIDDITIYNGTELTMGQVSTLYSGTSNNTPICAGSSINLTETSISGATYSWTGPNSFSSTSQNPTISNAVAANTGTYTVTVTSNGCSSTGKTSVTVNAIPTISSQPSTATQSLCLNASSTALTVTASAGSGTISTYQWYSNTTSSTSGGTAVGTSSSSYTPVTTVPGTLYYYVTITNSNGCTVTSNVSGAVTVKSSPYLFSQKPAGLTSYYKFSGNANDTTGADNGTLQNSPTSVMDRYGNASSAYSFNGSTQYISTATSYVNPSTFTISAWFKTTNNNGALIGFANAQTGTPGSQYDRNLFMHNGKILFGINQGGGGNVDTIMSTSTYNDGSWHMATATVSSTNGSRLYVDGVLVANNVSYNTPQNYTGYWRFGFNSSWSVTYFTGTIDDISIYNGTELTASQVSTLYSGTLSNTPVCAGSSINLTEISVSGATYSWTGPNSFSSASQNPTISNAAAANAGAYTVTVTANGCSSTGATSVTVNALPTVTFTASPGASVCSSTAITYTTQAGQSSYVWSVPGVLNTDYSITSGGVGSASNTVTLKWLTSGSKTVTVNYTNANGCTASSATSSATTVVNCTLTWTGTTSTAWNLSSNWSPNRIPTSSDTVVIASGVTNLATISTAASCNGITINSSATLNIIAGGALSVNGNLVNNGTLSDVGGTTTFGGSSSQTLSGTGTTTLYNLTINNSNGVTLSSATKVNGILTLTAGTFATGGNLSQNLYTGAIAGTGAGSTTGNIRFFKTIWGDRYHYLSSPITGRTAADWNDNVTIKFGAYANLYSYNEALNDTNQKVGWTAFTTTATTLQDVTGYALFFPLFIYNTMLDVSGPYTHSATFTSPTLTNTPCTFPVAKPSSDGWNLVGNPYPSTLDWTIAAGWTKPASLNNAIYMYDNRKNRYVSYVSGVGSNGGTQYIGSMQGFFVKMGTANVSGTLSVNNNARITSTLIDVWRTESPANVLRITAAIDSITDETVIRFVDNATEIFDGQLDAYKLYNSGNTPSLSSISASDNYSINSLPSGLTQKTIPLHLIAALDGAYSFTADLSAFSSTASVILEDRLLGITQDLSLNPTYTATLSKGDYQGRFFIHYNQKQSAVTGNASPTAGAGDIEISAYQQNVFILFPNQNDGNANITVFDAVGKKVYSMENTSINTGRIDFNLPTADGIYIVNVQTAAANKAQQIFVQK